MGASRILLGVVGRPHGVRGLVRVHSYADTPQNLSAYGALSDDAGRSWTLRWRGEGVAELRNAAGEALASREQAAALTNTRLYVDRDRLPPPDPDEFYLSDLVGLQAFAPDGTALGRVAAVHDYGAGPSLELAHPGAPPLLVPFTRASVPEIDVAGHRVVVAAPEEIVAGEPPP